MCDRDRELYPDWISFGFNTSRSLADRLADSLGFDLMHFRPGRFHDFQTERDGMVFRYAPKSGCQNRFVEIELKGEWWSNPENSWSIFIENVLKYCSDEESVTFFRLDVRCDTFHQTSIATIRSQVKGKKPKATLYMTEGSDFRGYTLGKSDFRIRYYDKRLEQEAKYQALGRPLPEVWHRLEVQLRGELVKGLDIGDYSSLSLLIYYGVSAMVSDRLQMVNFRSHGIEHETMLYLRNVFSTKLVQLPRRKHKDSEIQGSFDWIVSKFRKISFQAGSTNTSVQKPLPEDIQEYLDSDDNDW